jgi:hypothetical protein
MVFHHSAPAAADGESFLVETHGGAERALRELQFMLTDARAMLDAALTRPQAILIPHDWMCG